MSIVEFLKNMFNSLLDGSFERVKIINGMNDGFKELFNSGAINRLCHVSISAGDPDFTHEMSSMSFRSGFKIGIKNDMDLQMSEVMELSKYVLANTAFIRQLMTMGFDTLIIQGLNNGRGRKFSLKAYAKLNNYFIQ